MMDPHLQVRALCALAREMGMGQDGDPDQRDTYVMEVTTTMWVFRAVTEDDPEVVEMTNDLLQMALCMNIDTLRKTVVELVSARLDLLKYLSVAIANGELRYA